MLIFYPSMFSVSHLEDKKKLCLNLSVISFSLNEKTKPHSGIMNASYCETTKKHNQKQVTIINNIYQIDFNEINGVKT